MRNSGPSNARHCWGQACHHLAEAHILGGAVVEATPQYDATTNSAHVAAQMLFTELCLVVLD